MSQSVLERVLAVPALVACAFLLPVCNLALGLENFKDCPQDPGCPSAAPEATCHDGLKDGTETDIDCGGSCPACTDGKGCVTGGDCADKVCSQGACVAPSCTDGVKNGTETDVDCGGSCSPCAEGKGCGQNTDCKGMLCSTGTCQPTCTDGVKDGTETGVDCGGTCPACADGTGCTVAGDCQSAICLSGMCAAIDAWSKSFDSGVLHAQPPALSTAVDAANNVFLAGNVAGNLDFGMGPVAAGNGFFAKFDASGAPVWSNYVDGVTPNTVSVGAMAVDTGDNVYLTGNFSAELLIFPACDITPAAGASSAWVAKLNSSGQGLWCVGFGTSGLLNGAAIAVDGSGNTFVEGLLLGTATFGTTTLTGGATGFQDRFLVKLDPSGKVLWAQEFTASGLSGMTLDAGGNVILVGLFGKTTSFGGPTLTAQGSQDLSVAELDTNGMWLWSESFGHAAAGVSSANVAVDAMGNILVGGGFYGSIDFGGGPLTAAGASSGADQDVFLVKLGSTGTHLWSKNFGDSFNQTATNVAFDAMGQPIIAGSFESSVDFGGGPLVSTGGQSSPGANMFVAKFDATGKHLWSKGFGDPAGQTMYSLAVDSSGAAIVAGTFNTTLNFGTTATTALTNKSAGTVDIFLAKLRTP